MGEGVVEFTVMGNPQPQPRVRGRVVTPKYRKPFVQMYQPTTEKDPLTGQTVTARWVLWKHAIVRMARRYNFTTFPGACCVDLTFRFRRPDGHFRVRGGQPDYSLLKPSAPKWHAAANKHDRDNLDKLVLDALTDAQIWKGDGVVCAGAILKPYANVGEEPGLDVRIEPL